MKAYVKLKNFFFAIKDVGGAVFMASAAATPELFTNIISTFIADSDMGLGAIVGAQIFNVLGVSALASFVTSNVMYNL